MTDSEMVIVPDFVGQPVHVARDVAAKIGLGLASGDPDGPGIGSRTWPGLFWVTAQEPPAGAAVEPRSQVQIVFVEDGQARSGIAVRTGG
ncbi:MAG: PASTA domain-containing protein [Rhodoglobus sp.]